ncbi:polysaccharide biosynthesis/export family protein [Leptolyngbya sp. FACHB-261]|uniref:polysaccharide biosynthesis/export family protein n=1 Tax=Leptolyngbya sp. FACHB-261 TaxID=2692806 RepID=UPI001687E85B|nr:polysaccharide biosynthesis/export family protein [Leptolyngbya sp. FACHB-261]MBD2105163.1 polysaccharide biosynthesis/export family protein [Leptolyngbya sp. FACHB-261]
MPLKLPPKTLFVQCVILASAVTVSVLAASAPSAALTLSPGDRVRIIIPEGDEFAGNYVVNSDGALEFPFLGSLPVETLEPTAAAEKISQALVSGGYFRQDFINVSLQVLSWAPIEVTVQGATFQPGRVQINDRRPNEERQDNNQAPGVATPERYLTVALRAAGGVRPDADVANIRVIRGTAERTIDLSGVFSGQPVEDIPLVAGDQIIVSSTQKINNNLVRPSEITPPGIRVYLSNLSIPAPGNGQSANSVENGGFAYGARLSQAVIAANCVGGTGATNARRHAVLVRTNILTGKTETLNRPVEKLVRDSGDENNPFLMPGDGVACYDSRVTGLRDVFRTIGDIFSPFGLILNLFK